MKNKVTVYVPDDVFDDMKVASDLQQRSISWLVEHAWRLSRNRILGYPAVNGATVEDESYAS
jgi:uncharacterized small protein (TIGR04563 family)